LTGYWLLFSVNALKVIEENNTMAHL